MKASVKYNTDSVVLKKIFFCRNDAHENSVEIFANFTTSKRFFQWKKWIVVEMSQQDEQFAAILFQANIKPISVDKLKEVKKFYEVHFKSKQKCMSPSNGEILLKLVSI
jgi:hypothetical protein